MRALEKAVKQSSHAGSPPSPATLGELGINEFSTVTKYRSNSMLSGSSSDVSNSVATSNKPNEVLPPAGPVSAVSGLESCPKSVDVPELPDPIAFPSLRTPLHIAIQNKNASLVQLLLRKGADIARQDNDGSTVLHLAVESGQEDTVIDILKRGVDPNKQDFSGRTALFRAIEAGDHAVSRLLLDAASDPNLKDIWGNTALHLAVEANAEALVLLLLDYGAHVDP